MSFFKKFFDKGPSEKNLLLKGIKFEQAESKILLDREPDLYYLSSEKVLYHLVFHSTPNEWIFDLRQPESAYQFYKQQCAESQGAVLEMDVIILGGIECLRGLFKYKSQSDRLAKTYVGILWLPFNEGCLQITLEGEESGVTGFRESVVSQLCNEYMQFAPSERTVIEGGDGDLIEMIGNFPLTKIESDDFRWDVKFPEHPLTLVRKNIGLICKTIQLGPMMKEFRSFRP